jgi:TatD DNase family protein
MRLFDTHTHLDDEQLRERNHHWLTVAQQAGVIGVNTIGVDLASSTRCLQLALQSPQVFASVGIHPNYCQHANLDQWPEIEILAAHPRVVGIGETGLDRYWDYCPIETQRLWFARHIELSYQVQKPLVIHMRDCEADVIQSLQQNLRGKTIHGILHSYAASWETAKRCLDWGMYISFSGTVTYKKANLLREIAVRVPDDRILIETDSPYLAPEPLRSSRPNHPALVRYTANCLANLKQMELETFCELTTKNAFRVFGLPDDALK